jgi:hypothetical protein
MNSQYKSYLSKNINNTYIKTKKILLEMAGYNSTGSRSETNYSAIDVSVTNETIEISTCSVLNFGS